MLFNGPHGKTLVSDEFNQMCIDARVEARVQVLPNPGDPTRPMRVVFIKNFNPFLVKVTQNNAKKLEHRIPIRGELQIMLPPDEPLPLIERMEECPTTS